MNQLARRLRKEQTDAEGKLWGLLRNRQLVGFKFRRQHPVGPHILDLCCSKRKLIIEIDGGQHAEQVSKEEERTVYLTRMGYRVLRFWNNEVLQQLDSVWEVIHVALTNPLPGRERGREV